jgi:ribosomal protein L11 methyltransferase
VRATGRSFARYDAIRMADRTYSRLLIALEDAERAWDALYRAGTLGGWEDEAAGTFFAAFPGPESARAALDLLLAEGIEARLEADVPAPDPFAVHRASLSPFSIGGFRIDPRGEPDGGKEGEATLWIPAHGAFGTGLHASTQGILRWIDARDLAGRRILDVGCGSGILAIAAERRGAEAAVAFDRDADAVFEARRNLGRNGARRVRLFAGEIAALDGAFDAVFANMIWEESAPLVESIALRLAAGGIALFSGILDERESAAIGGIVSAGLEVVSMSSEAEWRTIAARPAEKR